MNNKCIKMPMIINMVYLYRLPNKTIGGNFQALLCVTSNSLNVIIGQGFAKMVRLYQLNSVRVFGKISGGAVLVGKPPLKTCIHLEIL